MKMTAQDAERLLKETHPIIEQGVAQRILSSTRWTERTIIATTL